MAIYDKYNTLITPIVSSATSAPDVVEIINRTFDGTYHVQTIGTAGTKVDVITYCTKSQKAVLDNIKRTSDTIKVVFDGYYYIGLIEDSLSWNRLPNQDVPYYGTQFTLLVTSQGVI